MAFPTIRGTPATSSTSGTTTHTINLSDSPVAGNLLLLFVSGGTTSTITDQTNDFDAAGFTTSLVNSEGQLIAGVHHVVAKVATGTEPATITLNTSASTVLSAICYEIQDWHGTIATGLASAVTPYATVTSTWNPPNLNPGSWGTEDTLWLAGLLANGILTSASSPGGNYTLLHEALASLSADGNIVIYSASQAVENDDPGSLTTTAISRDGVAFTIAIRPATSGSAAKFNYFQMLRQA